MTVTAQQHDTRTGTSSRQLAAHVILAVVILGTAIGALARAIRARRVIVLTTVGLTAVLAAAIAGSAFTGSQNTGASLAMALATAVSLLSYFVTAARACAGWPLVNQLIVHWRRPSCLLASPASPLRRRVVWPGPGCCC